MWKNIPRGLKDIVKRSLLYEKYQDALFARNSRLEIERNRIVRGPLIDRYLPKNAIGAELGVLKDNFSRVLIEFSQAKELHLIDPWYFLDAHWDWAGDNPSTVDALCKVLQENKKEINEKRVMVHVQDDLVALQSFEDHYFDWVYIDSSHVYDHTVKELELLHQKIKSKGIICGDDWRPDPSHRHHGVFKAVTEFMELHNYRLLYADENNLQWFITKNG